MVSITSVSSGQAGSYYEKHDYYGGKQQTDNMPGSWQGKGAEALGLSGEVSKEAFQNLLEGKTPNGKDQLVPVGPNGEHKAGTDLTFSAPKSVSVMGLVAGDERIKEAHEKAVAAALSRVEEKYAQCRIKEGGVNQHVNTCNLTIAKFGHETSRELDPQLHSHAVVLNATMDQDGKWRALDNNALYQAKIEIGQTYRNELAANIKDLGYTIEVTYAQKGLFEIAGVPKELMDSFSQRSAQVDAKVAELKESGQYPDASAQKLREIATLGSRAAKQHVSPEVARESWKERAEAQGFTHEKLREVTQEATRQAEVSEDPDQVKHSEYDYIRMSLNIQTANSSTFSQGDALKTAMRLSVGEMRAGELDKAFAELQQDKEIKQLGELKGKGIYTTSTMQKAERENVLTALDGQGSKQEILSEEKAAAALKTYQEANGITLKGTQEQAAKNILASKDLVHGVQGDAGTGKTTLLKAVNTIAKAEGHTLRGLAYTGKAASEIEQASGIKSQTLHSFLGRAEAGTLQIMSKEEHSKHTEKYDKLLEKLGGREALEKLSQPISKEELKDQQSVTKRLMGLEKEKVSLNTTTGVHGNTVIKQENYADAWLNRVKDDFKNDARSHITKGDPGHLALVAHEKNRSYDVYIKDKNGKVERARQVTSYTRDKSGEIEKINSWTLRADGSINHFSTNKFFKVVNVGKKFESIQAPSNIVTRGGTWVVDEASMLGSKQAKDLMGLAAKADAKIVLMGDTKQLAGISAGKTFKDLQEHGGMQVSVMNESIRQREDNYKQIVDQIAAKQTDQAIDKLIAPKANEQAKSGLHVISDRADRLEAIRQDYMKDPKSTLVVTARNADRVELNGMIRESMKAEGHVKGPEHEFTVRASKGLSTEAAHYAGSYYRGDIVFDSRGHEAKVIGIDRHNHTIKIQEVKGGQVRTIDLKNKGSELAVYQEQKQVFAQGEKVVFLKNNNGRGLKNGNVGEILKIDKDGQMKIKMEDGRIKQIGVNSYNYLDHGYAVTVHKSQGQTTDKVLYHGDTSKGSVTHNEFYVGASRGKFELQVYTDDLKAFREQAQQEQVKTSTLDDLSKLQQAHSRDSFGKDGEMSLKDTDREALAEKLGVDPASLRTPDPTTGKKIEMKVGGLVEHGEGKILHGVDKDGNTIAIPASAVILNAYKDAAENPNQKPDLNRQQEFEKGDKISMAFKGEAEGKNGMYHQYQIAVTERGERENPHDLYGQSPEKSQETGEKFSDRASETADRSADNSSETSQRNPSGNPRENLGDSEKFQNPFGEKSEGAEDKVHDLYGSDHDKSEGKTDRADDKTEGKDDRETLKSDRGDEQKTERSDDKTEKETSKSDGKAEPTREEDKGKSEEDEQAKTVKTEMEMDR